MRSPPRRNPAKLRVCTCDGSSVRPVWGTNPGIISLDSLSIRSTDLRIDSRITLTEIPAPSASANADVPRMVTAFLHLVTCCNYLLRINNAVGRSNHVFCTERCMLHATYAQEKAPKSTSRHCVQPICEPHVQLRLANLLQILGSGVPGVKRVRGTSTEVPSSLLLDARNTRSNELF